MEACASAHNISVWPGGLRLRTQNIHLVKCFIIVYRIVITLTTIRIIRVWKN
jgi:hypothetical protein